MKIALVILGIAVCILLTASASLFIKYCEARMAEENTKDRLTEIETALADARTKLNEARQKIRMYER